MTTTLNPPRDLQERPSSGPAAIDRICLDLDEMVSRLRRELWIGGILAIGTAAMASLLAMLVTDAVFQPESPWLRGALWIPLLGIIATVTRKFLITPLKSDCDRLAMAWTLEQKRPEIEERITTSLQLTETPNARHNALIGAVAHQAHGSLTGCQGEDLRGQEVMRRTIVAGASFAVLVLSMWIWAAYLIPSFHNVMKPWISRLLPYLDAAITPGHTHVEEGGDLRVTAEARDLSGAVLEVFENDTVIASHRMATDENGRTAEFTLNGLQSNRQYRVRAGGLFSDSYQIIVDPKPMVERHEFTLTFPEYTQLPPQTLTNWVEPIEAIHGTRIRIDLDATLPSAGSSLSLNETSIPCGDAVPVADTGLWRHRWEFAAIESSLQRGAITLVSEAGVRSEPFSFEVRALPDLPPSIVIDQPALSEIVTAPDRTIELTYHAFDDFGCGDLTLVLQKNGEPPSIRELPQASRKEFTEELSLDLTELELTSGDQLTVWLSIVDNRPDEYGGPQTTDSRKISMRIADDATSVGQQVVQNEKQAVLAKLTEALDGLKTAEQMTDELQADLNDNDNEPELLKAPVEAVEKAKQLQDHIKHAEQALSRLTDPVDTAPQRLFQQEVDRIQDVTENEVAEAKRQSGLVPLSDALPQQRELLAETKDSLHDAIEKIEDVRADIDERAKQLELAAQLDELARQQDQLAQEVQREQDTEPAVQHKQQQVADALQQVIEQNLDAKSEQFAQRADEAAKLTEAAADLKQQQEELAKLDQAPGKKELDEQLLELIAREQEQIANEARKLDEQTPDSKPPVADAPRQPEQNPNEPVEARPETKNNAIGEARKQMEAVSENLRKKDLEQAEVEASQAGQRLKEEARSAPGNAGAQPKAGSEDKAPAEKTDLERLVERQERIGEAIQAVREDRPEDAVAKLQEQIAEKTERLREKADELLQLPTEDPENQQAIQEAREKLEQARKETKAAEQLTKQPQDQAGAPEQAGEQQKQAAKSLQEAMQSLETVCKSCKKCSNCNNPGGSSSSGGNSSRNGGNRSESKPSSDKPSSDKPSQSGREGNEPRQSQPGEESGESSSKQQHPNSEKLAETADKAHQAAQRPSPERTQELADDLNELADEAAQRAGYPNRNSKPNRDKPNTPDSPESSRQASGSRQSKTPQPQGIMGKGGANESELAPTQLRGRSTSNWTRSRRMLKSNVLDDQDSRIPEKFRSVVKDYFEELSRLESRPETEEEQK